VRILYFADIRFPLERANGIQTMETCHAMARRAHEVTLVVRPDTNVPARDPFEYYGVSAENGLRIESAPVAGPAAARRFGYLAFALGRALGARRADVLFTRDLGVASALLGVPRALRAPVVYESHGYAPDVTEALPSLVATAKQPGASKLARLKRREERVWRSAEGYVTITRGLADELGSQFGDRASLAVVPDGTRLPGDAGVPAARHAEDSTRPFVVAYAGHLYAWKGVDVLIDALARLPDVNGLIVGGHDREPDLARVKQVADRLGIAARVRFTGLVEPSHVAGLLQRADVLALPNPASAISTRSTSPLKLFEYMAAGRPIVASDLPAIREILQNERTALLVPPGDPEALAGAVRRLHSDPPLAARLANAASTAVTDFTWDRRAERLETLLGEVVRTRG
jgi:glycosyltransferase involved in cell wall biosynthesis